MRSTLQSVFWKLMEILRVGTAPVPDRTHATLSRRRLSARNAGREIIIRVHIFAGNDSFT